MLIPIIINAATGRMGKELLKAVISDAATELSAGLARENHPLIGTDIGYLIGANPQGVFISSDAWGALKSAPVIIDFSLPEHSLSVLEKAVASNTAMIIGTTGFTDQQQLVIEQAAMEIPIVMAANFSVGVNSLLGLVKQATALIGEQADIEIFEAHHKHKVDAPSGTALAIGQAIAEVKGKPLSELAVEDRKGKREEGDIGFSVMRGGDIVGTHQVVFALNGEMITIEHQAQTRACFAQGAIEAAKWLVNKPAALYSMEDVLFVKG